MSTLNEHLMSLSDLIDTAIVEDGDYLIVAANHRTAEHLLRDAARHVIDRRGVEPILRRHPHPMLSFGPGVRIYAVGGASATSFARGRTFRAAAVLAGDATVMEAVMPALMQPKRATKAP